MVDRSKPSIVQRTVVVGVLWNEIGEVLLCKMKPDRGIFPNQWGLPGGGMHDGESTTEDLVRELDEELGLSVSHIERAFFKDGIFEKLNPNGEVIPMYIIFLVFNCLVKDGTIQLNEEFSESTWVHPNNFNSLDLNPVTLDTLTKAAICQRQSNDKLPKAGDKNQSCLEEIAGVIRLERLRDAKLHRNHYRCHP